MPKFDRDIQSAILSVIKQLGSQAELCKRTGISTSLMSRYCKGNAKNINMGTWKLIFPLIRPHLPPERRELLSYLPPRITPDEATEVGLAIAPDDDDAARVDRAIAALGGDELIDRDNKHAMPDLAAKWMRIALDDGVDALYRAILDCPEFILEVRVRLAAAVAERVAK